VPRYSGTNLVLTLGAVVALAQPVALGGKLSLPFDTLLGFTYVVQKTGALPPNQWQTLATIEGTGAMETAEDSAAQSQAYYRVLVQW
jgi:hypothetical protein